MSAINQYVWKLLISYIYIYSIQYMYMRIKHGREKIINMHWFLKLAMEFISNVHEIYEIKLGIL